MEEHTFLWAGNRGLSPVFVRVAPFALFIALLALQPLAERYVDARWAVLSRRLKIEGDLKLALRLPALLGG